MTNIQLNLSEKEFAALLSAVLFSCSVNVVSEVTEEFNEELVTLAKTLKAVKPDIKLDHIEFIEEDNYEDNCSALLLEEFKNNLKVVKFDTL